MTTKKVPQVTYDYALPDGVKLSKRPAPFTGYSFSEFFPLTEMELGASFLAKGYTARDLRGVIHKRSRTRGMRFVSRTSKNGNSARVWRIK